jgi:ubiquinol-cytochrome c reductase iron-sulfur subunit
MSTDGVDLNRRHFLTMATSLAGAVGVGAVAVPFLSSLQPSARARAEGAPVELNIGRMEPGEQVKVVWRGKAISVVRRPAEMLERLPAMREVLRDPDSQQAQQPAYAQNEARALKPEFLVIESVCTHLGCSPEFRPEVAPEDLGSDWQGGFFCPCHGSRFDLAGRVFKNVPAPLNLAVPPHKYLDDQTLLIGVDAEA